MGNDTLRAKTWREGIGIPCMRPRLKLLFADLYIIAKNPTYTVVDLYGGFPGYHWIQILQWMPKLVLRVNEPMALAHKRMIAGPIAQENAIAIADIFDATMPDHGKQIELANRLNMEVTRGYTKFSRKCFEKGKTMAFARSGSGEYRETSEGKYESKPKGWGTFSSSCNCSSCIMADEIAVALAKHPGWKGPTKKWILSGVLWDLTHKNKAHNGSLLMFRFMCIGIALGFGLLSRGRVFVQKTSAPSSFYAQ